MKGRRLVNEVKAALPSQHEKKQARWVKNGKPKSPKEEGEATFRVL